MKVALAVWNGRISPVFDVSRELVVLDVENDAVAQRSEASLRDEDPERRSSQLVDLEIETLICGAISQPLAGMLASYGVDVVPFIAGDVDEVIAAYLTHSLQTSEMAMPGCCERRRRLCGTRNHEKQRKPESDRRKTMPHGDGTGPQGRGPGTGRGRGGCGRRKGRQNTGDQNDRGGGAGSGRGKGKGRGGGRSK